MRWFLYLHIYIGWRCLARLVWAFTLGRCLSCSLFVVFVWAFLLTVLACLGGLPFGLLGTLMWLLMELFFFGLPRRLGVGLLSNCTGV